MVRNINAEMSEWRYVYNFLLWYNCRYLGVCNNL